MRPGARVKRSGEQRGSRAPSKVTFTAGQRCEIFVQVRYQVTVPVSAGNPACYGKSYGDVHQAESFHNSPY